MLPTSVVWLIASALLLLVGCNRRDPVEVSFFCEELCPACDTYKRAESITERLAWIGKRNKNYSVESHNLIDPAATSILRDVIEKNGLPDVSLSIPLLFVGNTYYVGYDDIEAAVDALEAK